MEGVSHAFTLGLRYAFLTMTGIVLAAMTFSALQPAHVEDPKLSEADDMKASKTEV